MKRLYEYVSLAAALICFTMLVPKAHADLYSVYTLAQASGGFGCGYGTSYSTASGANAGSSTPQPGIVCTSTINGSSPIGPGATDATSQSQYSTYINGYRCNGYTDTQTAYANANLAAGQVHLDATDVNNYGNYSGGGGSGGNAIAEISDTLYFTIPHATPSTVTDLGVTFVFAGTVSNPAALENGYGNGTQVRFGGSALWGSGCTTPQGFASYTILECVSNGYILQATYAVTGATATVPFSMGMAFATGGNDDVDFDAGVTLQLPAGVTYTSASGVFPTADVETPEPAASAPLLAGLCAIAAAIAWRRKRNERKVVV